MKNRRPLSLRYALPSQAANARNPRRARAPRRGQFRNSRFQRGLQKILAIGTVAGQRDRGADEMMPLLVAQPLQAPRSGPRLMRTIFAVTQPRTSGSQPGLPGSRLASLGT
jgi:hypothetical protein